MLVYKRVAGLAGHTSRVSELLEAVGRLSHETHHEAFLRNLKLRCCFPGAYSPSLSKETKAKSETLKC
jgi:hypothetical protein